jgi:hypothetical protein
MVKGSKLLTHRCAFGCYGPLGEITTVKLSPHSSLISTFTGHAPLSLLANTTKPEPAPPCYGRAAWPGIGGELG